MNSKLLQLLISLLFLSTLASTLFAATNQRRGNLYFNQVCMTCHQKIHKINHKHIHAAPKDKSMEDWVGFFATNQHPDIKNKKVSVTYFFSKPYRQQIKNTHPAAKKLLNIKEKQLLKDVRTYLIAHSKDSDNPVGCQ